MTPWNTEWCLLQESPFPLASCWNPPFLHFHICQRPCPTTRIAKFLPAHPESYRLQSKTWLSLVAQRLGIHLPMQGTRVRALVWEEPTCPGATKPVHHNCWACAPEPTCHNYWAQVPQLLKPMHLEPVLRNGRGCRNEKPAHHNEQWPLLAATGESGLRAQQWRPNTAKYK